MGIAEKEKRQGEGWERTDKLLQTAETAKNTCLFVFLPITSAGLQKFVSSSHVPCQGPYIVTAKTILLLFKQMQCFQLLRQIVFIILLILVSAEENIGYESTACFKSLSQNIPYSTGHFGR